MDIVTITLIAFGLAMDAMAVSVTSGIAIKRVKINNALKIALFFGGFQAFMPIVGWLAGLSLVGFISGVDHWMAFGLLSFIGGKMIFDSPKIESHKEESKPLTLYVLLVLSVATSIDALAVGLSFAFLKISIAAPVIIIGTVTFLFSLMGVFAGAKLGHLFENKIEIVGGFVLIGIGIKILVEHLI
ncbi:MAG: manganese efflux pump MntP family protein [Candidatus Bathyarchaeia archaeon]|nr:manganese efflux pump [Candidatus Bathyarchaeota archaeon A05DMB-4]MDH7595545.1 manganese efflux pump MntP family protein [Candidatus Bathyarchaeota archaeon]